jgi:hypothetical protein
MERFFSSSPVGLAAPALPSARRSLKRRRWLFRVVVLLLVAAVAEAGSYFTYWAASGHRFSYEDIRRQQQRLLERKDIEERKTNSALRTEIHPYIGFVYNPHCKRYILPGENPTTRWGFTDREGRSPVRKRAANKVIVGVVGASVASIFAGSGAEALTRELQCSPAFSGKEIEIVSLAVGGYKQPQQLMSLEYVLALGGEFDIVINLDGFNEIAWPDRNLAAGGYHLYPPGWPWVVNRLPNPDSRRMVGKIVYLADQRAEWASFFRRPPLCWSITAALIWKLRDHALDRDQVESEEALTKRDKIDFLPYECGPPNQFRDEADMMRQLVDDWERGSQLIADVCRARGIRYYHFLQPNQYVPGSKTLTGEERKTAFSPTRDTQRYVNVGYPLLREAGRRLVRAGVNFRDLSMIFAPIRDTLYVDVCCHFNRTGNELVAAEVARTILETPEPPRAPEH